MAILQTDHPLLQCSESKQEDEDEMVLLCNVTTREKGVCCRKGAMCYVVSGGHEEPEWVRWEEGEGDRGGRGKDEDGTMEWKTISSAEEVNRGRHV